MKAYTHELKSRSVAELEKEATAIVKDIQQSARPILITQDGKPTAVMLDIATYEKQVHTIELARLLFQAEKDIREGKTQPISEFINELRRVEKVSG